MLAAGLVAWLTTSAVAQSGNVTTAQPTGYSDGTFRFAGAQPPASEPADLSFRLGAFFPAEKETADSTMSKSPEKTPRIADSRPSPAKPTDSSFKLGQFSQLADPVKPASGDTSLGAFAAEPNESGTNRPARHVWPATTEIRLKTTPAKDPVSLASLRQIVDRSPEARQQNINKAHAPVQRVWPGSPARTPPTAAPPPAQRVFSGKPMPRPPTLKRPETMLGAHDAPKDPVSHELTTLLQFSRGAPRTVTTQMAVHHAAAPPPVAAPPGAGLPVAAPPIAAPAGAADPALQPLVPLPEGAQPKAGSTGQLGPFQVLDHTDELEVVLRRSKLLRTPSNIYRTAVVDPGVCDVVQFTPREVSVLGKGQGATHVTFWFEDGQTVPITLLVRVRPDPEVQQRREEQFGVLENVLAKLFPESKVKLTPVADKLIVKGQARDAAEAAQILAVVRGQAVYRSTMVEGQAAPPMAREETNTILPASNVINMLRIPGVHQVALRVKIAELNRSAARQFGVDINSVIQTGSGNMIVRSLLNLAAGNSTSILGEFDNQQINFGIHYLESHGVIRMLSEPTLVTLSGRPASFVAGGEFAVPTTVGVGGVGAVTTDFRAFGAIITFIPTVIDKDFIRLEVAPEFSRIDTDLSVGGTPGLSTRAVTTTVEMREGQTLAIAGLLDDSTDAETQSDLPIVAKIFGAREVTRNETELIILVTPELVEPIEPEAVPPLPGFDVTEPTNAEFYLMGRIEGRPTHEYRSTVWPRLRRRYRAGGPEMISGPFGHGD